MPNEKTKDWLARYKGEVKTKDAGCYVGTAYEISPQYPTMYKRSAPGDIGWAHDKNEQWYAKVNNSESLSTIASRTHNRTSGYHSKIADVESQSQYLRLPGMHTTDFLRHCKKEEARSNAARNPLTRSMPNPLAGTRGSPVARSAAGSVRSDKN